MHAYFFVYCIHVLVGKENLFKRPRQHIINVFLPAETEKLLQILQKAWNNTPANFFESCTQVSQREFMQF